MLLSRYLVDAPARKVTQWPSQSLTCASSAAHAGHRFTSSFLHRDASVLKTLVLYLFLIHKVFKTDLHCKSQTTTVECLCGLFPCNDVVAVTRQSLKRLHSTNSAFWRLGQSSVSAAGCLFRWRSRQSDLGQVSSLCFSPPQFGTRSDCCEAFRWPVWYW